MRHYLKAFRANLRDENGAVDIGGILMMGIGMVFLAVGFIMFPIVTDATDDLLAYTGGTNITDDCFTGFTAVIGITPLLILVGYLSAALFSMYLGVKMVKTGGGTKLNLGNLILLGISLIFVAIGLIILPVALDGLATILGDCEGGSVSASYTGLVPILLVTPLLILISFISSAVIAGYFGLTRLGGD